MIPPDKLKYLKGGQKRRKLALCFGALERDIRGIPEPGNAYSFSSLTRSEYIVALTEVVLKDDGLPPSAREELIYLKSQVPVNELHLCNCARNHLLALIGTFPAEWDLIIAPHPVSNEKRRFYSGIQIYAEDIRSPFNLGSIFRTAEAFGAEKLFLSPCCCPPEHPRAQRSAMGCIDMLPWERVTLSELPSDIPVFVLETGGTPIGDFVFPSRGIVIIGSEELGVSPEALQRASYGCVSIPMTGLKCSLNVGVAFGILMQSWISSI